MNTEQERAEFEAWAQNSFELHRHSAGEYSSNFTQTAWAAWQARAALQSHKPNVEFEDPRVQLVYGIICGGHEPPEGEHWDGYVSRLIVDALQSQDREDAERFRFCLRYGFPQKWEEGIRGVIRTYWTSKPGAQDEFPSAIEAIDHARRAEGEL